MPTNLLYMCVECHLSMIEIHGQFSQKYQVYSFEIAIQGEADCCSTADSYWGAPTFLSSRKHPFEIDHMYSALAGKNITDTNYWYSRVFQKNNWPYESERAKGRSSVAPTVNCLWISCWNWERYSRAIAWPFLGLNIRKCWKCWRRNNIHLRVSKTLLHEKFILWMYIASYEPRYHMKSLPRINLAR